MAKVILQSVFKIYKSDHGKNVTAVRNFNLEVNDREFVVFVGPSGCGKSTTLRMIAGLEEISQGDVYIDQLRVNDVPPKDRDIAMVFQNYALYPHMSVYDNLAFALKLRNFSRSEIQRRVQQTAEILGIESYLDRKPKALSGGQKQRVAVGRAIVRQPKVFLFDEPLSNLDAKMRVQMRSEITKLHQRLQATMIYVTHDQIEAMTMGDRIVVMKDGVIQQVNTPLHLYEEPVNLFVAGFLGSPPMNFVRGTLHQSAGGLLFKESYGGSIACNLSARDEAIPYIGKDIVLGIRPEDIALVTGERPSGSRFQAVVDMVEAMGAESHIHLQTGANMLVCRSDAALGHSEIGRRREFAINVEKVHLFDPITTVRLTP
jgi:multiple sugar transport system ATP-binding protein